MENIIDYVKDYGVYSMQERPFNEADSLVLCQLSYLNYTDFVKGLEERNEPIRLVEICKREDAAKLLEGYWYKEDNTALLEALSKSERFQELKLNYFVNIINETSETQFAAITFILPNRDVYLAYRGTDATLIGWKEDLNIALSDPTHSQELAKEYMNRVSQYIAGDFYVGGHSKGGNLAVYATMFCEKKVQDKIKEVFNHDGPGFRPELLERGNYPVVANRIHKFIPKSSVVGVIMESNADYEVVESRSVGVMQHNSYNWKIVDGHFIRAESRTQSKRLQDEALNQWILSLSQEQLHAFVDTLYTVIAASGADNVFEFSKDIKKSFSQMSEAMKGLDEDTKQNVQKILRALFEITGERYYNDFMEKLELVKKELLKQKKTK